MARWWLWPLVLALSAFALVFRGKAGPREHDLVAQRNVVLTLEPDAVIVPPRGSQQFVAGGGESGGPFEYAMQSAPSGGSIDATGAYVAGPLGNVTDVVRATDPSGATVTSNVTVTAGVSLTAGSATVAPLGTTTVTAIGGVGAPYTYHVDPARGASVSPAGAFVAGAIANVVETVTATDSLGNTGAVEIAVGAGIAVTPSAPSVAPRESVGFVATGGSGSGYTWSSVALPSGGSISATGSYVAGAAGSVTDQVKVVDSLGNSRTLQITVGAELAIVPTTTAVAPREARTFATTGGSGQGLSWSFAARNSGGSIAASTGVYTAGAIGNSTDTIQVQDGLGNVATATVAVGPGVSVAGVHAVTPRESLTLVASGGSGMGYALSLEQNESGASVLDNVYTAGPLGDRHDVVRVTDSLGNFVDVTIVVGPGVHVTPQSPTAPPLGSIAFDATGGSGGYLWSIAQSGSGAASISAAGVYVAGAIGNSVDTVQVIDSRGNVASVTVSVGGGLVVHPSAPSLAPGATLQLVASGGSNAGYTWLPISMPSGGGIGANGLYTAGRTGSTQDQVRVTDSLGNIRDVTVQVTAGVVAAAAPISVAPRGAARLTASGGSGSGFTWAFVSNFSGGTVNAAGDYLAGTTGGGTDVVRARDSLGNVASVSIPVTPALALTPPGGSTPPRGRLVFAASGGAQPHTFSLQTNASGATIVASTGRYQAGPTPNVQDVVAVTDANGVFRTAAVAVGAGIGVVPSVASVAPGTTVAFAASGGSGSGYTWSMLVNASGASIGASTGLFVAGTAADTVDVIRVTDSLLNTKDVSIAIGAALAVAPSEASVPPRGSVTFSAVGGTGNYTYSLVQNASGGHIGQLDGGYVAGPTPSVQDRIRVADNLGNAAFVDVQVGPGVAVAPRSLVLAPRATATFAVSGGSGQGYRWSLSQSGSGGHIDPSSGSYVAGPRAGRDRVHVADALGNEAQAEVLVEGAASTPGPGDRPSGSDAGADASSDDVAPVLDQGCGCRSAAPAAGRTDALLLALAALYARRRQRRVGRATCSDAHDCPVRSRSDTPST